MSYIVLYSDIVRKEHKNMIKRTFMETKTLYYPPQTDVLELKSEGVLCASQPVINYGSGEDRLPWEEL